MTSEVSSAAGVDAEVAADVEPGSGWSALVLGVVALVCGGAAALGVLRASLANDWSVARLSGLAMVVLAVGVVAGSERLLAVATVPLLAGVVVGALGSDQVAWASALMIGCGWFVAIEAGLASIDARTALHPTLAVGQQRLSEVATIVAVGAIVGLLGPLAAALAPERTLVVRSAVLVAVLTVLVIAARRLHRP